MGYIGGKGESTKPIYIVWVEGSDGFIKRYDIPIHNVAFIEDDTLNVEASDQTWENGIHEIQDRFYLGSSSRVLIHLPKGTIIQKIDLDFEVR
ncbi:hypothetical protein LEP1GSC170_1211 [Leptospira interrogans serovar Bataviae str. HAI135]|nr:hypothetical protein LEP1GSC170_1211 [Leptospira interrogans serovar Bataviae str. HAI135]